MLFMPGSEWSGLFGSSLMQYSSFSGSLVSLSELCLILPLTSGRSARKLSMAG